MIILHCIKEREWIEAKKNDYYGEKYIEAEGFIHCSDVNTFHKVAPNFRNAKENLLLLLIETDKVKALIKWEDDGGYGTNYPHIYGLLNIDAVVDVAPYIKDDNGDWIGEINV